jgi:hypothetical protein
VKTLDGLMVFLAKRLTDKQYRALMRQAAMQGLGLRDYVGRYVLKMVEAKFAARRAA